MLFGNCVFANTVDDILDCCDDLDVLPTSDGRLVTAFELLNP